ncbi:Inositol oxygenase 2 [Glycine max]|nr:Inositol oxygenase 2 [Glycine max]
MSRNCAKKMREEYGKLNKVKMSIWECCEMLDKIVDVSDPDLEESQIQHALQTAETISDFGKALLLPSFGGLPQWAVVAQNWGPKPFRFFNYWMEHREFKKVMAEAWGQLDIM